MVQRRYWLYSEEAGSRVEWRGQLNRFNWISSQSLASSRPSPPPHPGVWSNLRQWAIFSVSTLCLYTAAEPRPRRLNDWCCLCRNGHSNISNINVAMGNLLNLCSTSFSAFSLLCTHSSARHRPGLLPELMMDPNMNMQIQKMICNQEQNVLWAW